METRDKLVTGQCAKILGTFINGDRAEIILTIVRKMRKMNIT